jgi:hypothetical protein
MLKFLFYRIDKNNSIFNWTLIVFGMFWILFHFVTIERSPLPNFDEAFFASMTKSFQQDGSLMLRMSTMTKFENDEVWLYGPIYFFCQSFITQYIGWGIWQFRLLNLLAGFGIVAMIMVIARSLSMKRLAMILLFSMLVMDPELNANMHSGRMDSLAMLFFLIGIYLFFFIQKKMSFYIIFAALFFSAALLTTPRVGFLILILPVGFLMELYFSIRMPSDSRVRRLNFWPVLIKYFITLIVITVPFLLWIIFRVGGLEIYFKEFSNNDVLRSLVSYLNIPKFYLLPAVGFYVLILMILVFLSLYKRIVASKNVSSIVVDWRIIVLALIPAIYVIFIKGGYYVYMMPVLYMLLTYMTMQSRMLDETLVSRFKWLLTFYFITLLAINMAIFSIKSLYLFGSWQSRDPHFFQSYFKRKHIKEENVLASHPYHFVISEENRYLSNDDNREMDAVKADRLMVKYAFVTIKSYENETSYFKQLGFKEVERFKVVESKNIFLNRILSKLPLDILQSYDGVYLHREIGAKPKEGIINFLK